MNIQVFTQSAIKLTGEKIIYFDPYQISNPYHDADYIFITHDHYDHYDEKSIKNVMKENTKIIVPIILEEQIKKITDNILLVKPEQEYKIDDITFKTLPAYNLYTTYHLKANGYVGYNIFLNNKWLYIMGDTDVVEEIAKVKTDICFVPIGGTFTMDYEQAAHYINSLNPQKVIPIHYGSIVGDINLKDKFKELINDNIEVDIYIKEEEK